MRGTMAAAGFAVTDRLRQAQGRALEAMGYGPQERGYRVLASGKPWRLRDYGGGGGADGAPAVIVVPAPIKRPYIWDLAPDVSAVGRCLEGGFRVFVLEWLPPAGGEDNAGLETYADRAIGAAVAAVARETGQPKPFLIGHSLGGTFAAIFAALEPDALGGLVLLGAPLCFRRGISRFRDRLVAIVPPAVAEADIVPGSLLSQLSAVASPETFVWSRFLDAARSAGNADAVRIYAQVERWALDEVPLPGKLVQQTLDWLYREDRFSRGSLTIRDRTVGPADLRLPVLAVVTADDEVAPLAGVQPVLDAMPGRDARIVDYPGEAGVGLQHLGLLVGRRAHAEVWPQIVSWIAAHGRDAGKKHRRKPRGGGRA